MKIVEISNQPGHFIFHCPGCDMTHQVITKSVDRPNWIWNGSMESPTFSPSLLVQYPWGNPPVNKVCHSFIREGKIQFLGDCTHHLAGQTVEIPDFEKEHDPTCY